MIDGGAALASDSLSILRFGLGRLQKVWLCSIAGMCVAAMVWSVPVIAVELDEVGTGLDSDSDSEVKDSDGAANVDAKILWQVAYLGGVSSFHGDLSRQQHAFTSRYLLLGKFSNQTHLSWGWSFEVLSAHVQQDFEAFPFPQGEDLKVLAFLLMPQLCSEQNSVDFCAGLGLGTVNVNAAQDRRDYGTWHYDLQMRKNLSSSLSALASLKYIGKIEQRVAGDDSEFYFASLGFGLGYQF